MKNIGEGYYYKVFDLGNGRVLKKIKKGFPLFWFIFRKRFWEGDWWQEYRKMAIKTPKVPGIYKEILGKLTNLSLLGNPTFIDDINYKQDKVVVIKDFLETASLEESKRIIDGYVHLIKELWKFGISERVYNFTINNGVDRHGTVILIDFNAIYFERADIEERVRSRFWEKAWSRSELSQELGDYYDHVMSREITIESLEEHWMKSLL